MGENSSLQESRPTPKDVAFLGFRGLLAVQTILYILLEIFFPAVVVHSANSTGAQWQLFLRKSLSVFLWNPSIIRASLIILSARTICLPFLAKPTSITLASAIFRRPVRLFIPLAIALAVTTLFNNLFASTTIGHFKTLTKNVSLTEPYMLPTAISYFNALYTLFWSVRDYPLQAASKAFYNDSLWAISVIFTQSYTVYLASVIVPYTRPKWRQGAWLLFIITAWWVQSWAWYSISGLLFADAAMHMRLRERAAEGVDIRFGKACRALTVRVPGWVFAAVAILVGGVLQYFWREWRPQFPDGSESAVAQPQAREDDFLLVMGFLLLLESQKWLRRIMSIRILVAVGERSLSKCCIYDTNSEPLVDRIDRLISRWEYHSKYRRREAVFTSIRRKPSVVFCCHGHVHRRVFNPHTFRD